MLSLTPRALQILAEHKLIISKVSSLGYIHPDISFETPAVIQSEIFMDGILKVGAFTGVFGGRLRHITIGRYCSIAPGLLCGFDEHPMDRLTTSMIAYLPNVHGWAQEFNVDINGFEKSVSPFAGIKAPTSVGNDVWIGANVFLKSGVVIGDGAIIGAGAVVTGDVPPYSIVAGSPARIIRYRFPEQLIAELIQIKWWRFNIFDLPPNLLENPEQAIKYILRAEAEQSINEYNPPVIDVARLREIAEESIYTNNEQADQG